MALAAVCFCRLYSICAGLCCPGYDRTSLDRSTFASVWMARVKTLPGEGERERGWDWSVILSLKEMEALLW